MITLNIPICEHNLVIPNINELGYNSILNNKKISLMSVNGEYNFKNPDMILSNRDALYRNVIQNEKYEDDYQPYLRIIKIDNKKYYYYNFVGSHVDTNFWVYIGKFYIRDKMVINDPCYLNGNETNNVYTKNIKDTFYGFCYISYDNYISDVAIINSKLFNDNPDINITSKMTDIKDLLYVDSGCITFCNYEYFMFNNNELCDVWYKNEIINKIDNKAFTISNGGIVTSSGYGDGVYSIKCYENGEHLAYYVNFISYD